MINHCGRITALWKIGALCDAPGGKVAPIGKYPLPTRPGLGFDLDEKQVARYRFEGTRPMARVFHPDGAVAAW